MKRKINKAFTNATPNVLDSVSRDCPERQSAPVAVKARPAGFRWKVATCAMAVILAAVLIIGGIGIGGNYASAATVSLDVNPSVEIKLNNRQRVVSVTALNDDGKIILGNMDLKGSQLEVAVNALIGSMLRNGYLSEISNSVLVSVDSSAAAYNGIAQAVTEEITVLLNNNRISASVLTQWIQTDDAISALAKQYGISVGKAQLVYTITQKSTLYTQEQLVTLTVNELGIILGNLNIQDGNLSHSGSASDKAYIGKEAALAIAFEKMGLEGLTENSRGVFVKENKLDFDDGMMVYEIEFLFDGGEYDVEIDAISGKLVAFECSKEDDFPVTAQLGKEEIVSNALKLAGAPDDGSVQVEVTECAHLRIAAYSLWFTYGGSVYNYEIDCYGNVLYSYSKATGETLLTPQQAVQAFEQANEHGLTSADVTKLRVTVKTVTSSVTEGDTTSITEKTAYSLRMDKDGQRYLYEVDAVSGAVSFVSASEYVDVVQEAFEKAYPDCRQWQYWRDVWYNWRELGGRDEAEFGGHYGGWHGGTQGTITQEEALNIVLEYAGVNRSDIRELECELDSDDCMRYYEIEFKCNGYEYEAEVNAHTGSIMKFEKDRD